MEDGLAHGRVVDHRPVHGAPADRVGAERHAGRVRQLGGGQRAEGEHTTR